MNNNIDTIDLEDELFEHFRFEVPKAKHPCELINT
jgi:23S rRNA pseudouridine1911/1915/1917 synthase